MYAVNFARQEWDIQVEELKMFLNPSKGTTGKTILFPADSSLCLFCKTAKPLFDGKAGCVD